MSQQSSGDGTRVSGVARHVATAGKVSAIAVLGIALFASPVCAPHAGAADLFPKGSNATLVFSPTTIGDGEGAELCAWNRSDVAVQVTFVFTRLSAGHQSSASPATIGAGDLKCDTLVNTNSFFGASIVLESPFQCSQAAEYPGKCGVVASLEIREFSGDVITGPARLHTEPVLKPASPRLQPPLIAPQ